MFTILLRRGRLTIRLLQQHTQLSRRQLRHGLAVLIQQNLIYHFYESDSDETFYEANQGAAYGLIRSGKLMEIAEGKYGSVGLDVVRNLLLLGQSKVSDLIDVCAEAKTQEAKLKENGKRNGTMNGVNGGSHITKTNKKFESTLAHLVEDGLVEVVKKSMFCSPTDTHNEIEQRLLKENFGGSTKGTKQKEELKEGIRLQLQSLRTEAAGWPPKGKKRAFGEANGINGSSKRRKTSQGTSAVNGDYDQGHDDIRLEVGFLSF
jgi:DNA-directed RNA polymerase III subunit RPC3